MSIYARAAASKQGHRPHKLVEVEGGAARRRWIGEAGVEALRIVQRHAHRNERIELYHAASVEVIALAQRVEGAARRAVKLESQRRERIENLVEVEKIVRFIIFDRKFIDKMNVKLLMNILI